ncbi:MAG: peptidoglycan-associated lipoprotein Pal [Cardiobacteriaceae bacterium]|nr:peptidoglycan-associated lipoprotein Pal [Cardiobacteriaceae bacterium]
MQSKKIFSLIALLTVLLLSACSKPYNEGEGNTDGMGADGGVYGADGYTVPGGSDIYGNQAMNNRAQLGDFYEDPSYGVNVQGGPQSSAKDRVIYFAYDSAELDSRSLAVLRVHSQYLREHGNTRVVLEGHTDERGTQEYNIALGERRAYSVRNQFISEGVNPEQIRVLSYGEERPAADCQDESCYARNRRAVIVY